MADGLAAVIPPAADGSAAVGFLRGGCFYDGLWASSLGACRVGRGGVTFRWALAVAALRDRMPETHLDTFIYPDTSIHL